MTVYSGRTTSYSHKRNDWETYPPNGQEAIQKVTVFEVQWSNCPVEVEREVKDLWSNNDLGNDVFYYHWVGDRAETYPLIAEYLQSKNVTECLIHWWW